MTVRTDPPGALAIVDNQELGFTPVSTSFLYYGTRQVKLIKDGHETLTVQQPIEAPWYEWFPFEFFSENLVPWTIHDERMLTYRLQPKRLESGEQLLDRAESLRRDAQVPPIPSPSLFEPPF